MLDRQLVHFTIRPGGEGLADKVIHIEVREGHVLAGASHPVREIDGLLVAVMRSDQIGIVDPAVINILAGLHLGLDFFDDVTFLDEIVLQLDPGDFAEGLGQNLGLVFVRCDCFRHNVDFHACERLGRINKPFHFLHLLVFRERRRLELGINPFFRFVHACKGRNRTQQQAESRCGPQQITPLNTTHDALLQ